MKYAHLGRSGMSVSRVCLGTMNFGEQTSEADAFRIMDEALELGVNFFDTANVYGGAGNRGATESILGRWFAQGGGRREKVVLATKLFGVMSGLPHDGGLSALNIRNALDASLTRLQTDHVELYQFHHVDRSTSWDEIWQAIDVAVQQGKVVYAGSSNFAGWHIASAQAAAAARGSLGLVSEQSLYNLVERTIELEVIPAAQANGIGILPWSPLHGGVLAGTPREGREGSRRRIDRSKEALENRLDQLREYESLCDSAGVEPGAVALAWLLSRPAVTAPIIGPRTLEQLQSGVEAVDVELDADLLDELDRIFPGHKPAPEDYAW